MGEFHAGTVTRCLRSLSLRGAQRHSYAHLVAPEWTEPEMKDLARRWQRQPGFMGLPGSCPHCAHNGAFSTVFVPGQYANHLGDRYLGDVDLPAAATTQTFPARWRVECQCGHADHDGDAGCGRSGQVEIPTTRP